jgi:hypothetical protein
MYTVQDLAKMYHCTRQTIYKKFEHEDLQVYTYKDDKGLKLKQEGLQVLNCLLADSNINTKKQEINKQIDITHTTDKLYVESLKAQIEMLSRQVDSLERDKISLERDKSKLYNELYNELKEQRLLLTSGEVKQDLVVESKGIFKRIFNLK